MFKPKEGEMYYSINFVYLDLGESRIDSYTHDGLAHGDIKIGNCFPTKHSALLALNKIKKILKG